LLWYYQGHFLTSLFINIYLFKAAFLNFFGLKMIRNYVLSKDSKWFLIPVVVIQVTVAHLFA